MQEQDSEKKLLMVFVKNLEKGNVKTRLAKEIGDSKALQVYESLLDYTRKIILPLEADIQIWFSSRLPNGGRWNQPPFELRVQPEGDLGFRMKEAFRAAFEAGYNRVVIIGSDCAELTTGLVQQAFQLLHSRDVIIGPARDGGYYLLGKSRFLPDLFDLARWSTDSVFNETVDRLEEREIHWDRLPVLNDVDYYDDWRQVREKLQS